MIEPRRTPALERIAARVRISPNGCWIFTGALVGGYGLVGVRHREHGQSKAVKLVRVHRYVYEAVRGPIPEGLTLDHLCHNRDLTCPGGSGCEHRACFNPAHLEAVTFAENMRRYGDRYRARVALGYPVNRPGSKKREVAYVEAAS